MNPDDFIKNLNAAINKTANDMLPTMEEAALTGKALLAKRVQNEGFGKVYLSRGYKKLRALKGYEIRFVNLTFSGAMFRGWKVPNSMRTGLKVSGSVSGTDQETKNKLNWNKSRFPTFDKLQEDDKAIVKEFIQERLHEALTANIYKQ